MPYIDVKTSAALTEEKCEAIKSELGRAISVIPGKSERWLMVGITPECRLWFAGDASSDCAMVKVAVFGSLSDGAADKMTAEVTKILSREAGIAPDKIYVSYSEHSMWGWSGSNF